MTLRRRALAVLLVVLLVVPTAATGLTGSPELSASLPEPRVTPGEETTLTVELMNAGDIEGGSTQNVDESRVLTARGVSASLRAGDAPVDVRTGARLVGSMGDGATASVSFDVHVEEDAAPGTYRLPVRVSYKYTDQVVPDQNFRDRESARETFFVTVEVVDEARFRIVDTGTDAPVGGDGNVSVTLRNVGTAAANDSRVSLTAGAADLTLGNGGAVSQFVGNWSPNGTRTVEVAADVAPGAGTRPYTVSAAVTYQDDDGATVTSETRSAGVTPLAEQTFAVRGVESTLRVGDEGRVRGRVVNTGPLRVENAVVVLEGVTGSVDPVETEYAVGALAPGEAAEFAFDADVTDGAEAGPRQATFRLRYRRDGDLSESDSMDADVAVAERADEFDVAAVSGSFRAGGGGQLVLEVTNPGETAVTDVSAKVFVESPLSSGDDEAFVERLGPGETAELTFDLGVAGGATAKTYPVKVDFQYDDAEGETLLSDTYQVPVEVTRAESGGGLPVLPVAGAVVLVLAAVAGVALYRRRGGPGA